MTGFVSPENQCRIGTARTMPEDGTAILVTRTWKESIMRYPERLLVIVILAIFCATASLSSQQIYRSVEDLPQFDSGPEGILLRPKRLKAAGRETRLEESDILGCIQRWHGQVYDSESDISTPYLWAVLMDPTIEGIVQAIRDTIVSATTTVQRIQTMNEWMMTHMTHTQMHSKFRENPGNDPWGLVYLNDAPTFKKLLPSEMVSMRLHTGKISGKCITLANLIAGIFLRLGVDEDDVFHALMQMGGYRHGSALVKYGGELVIINNNTVQVLRDPPDPERETSVIALYTHRCFRDVSFQLSYSMIDSDALRESGSLFTSFIQKMGVERAFSDDGRDESIDLGNREDLVKAVFEDLKRTRIKDLTRYAYQSLYVKYPGYYLTASLQMSGPRRLIKNFKNADDVFVWIRKHIRDGSIFPDRRERLMTADQVLVFQQGSAKDKAVLAYTLLRHLGFDPEIVLTGRDAYIRFEGRMIDVLTGKEMDRITGNVLFCLRAKERFPGMAEARRIAHRTMVQGDTLRILDAFLNNVKKYPKAWEAHEELGYAYREYGYTEMAMQHLKKADRLGPAKVSRLKTLARLALLRSQARKSTGYLMRAVHMQAWKPLLQADLVQSYIFEGRLDEAGTLFTECKDRTVRGKPFQHIVSEGLVALKSKGVDHPDVEPFLRFMEEEGRPSDE